ncbi:response regulator [Sphingomonas sp. TDK1]|uniref:response regulator n=1 Tax=Sphingomonas sp. TDK1 TaxID=453247 RepID=UPI000A47BCB5|nr:response regulator [Sphingomonas sp. TDK1]
MAIVDDDPDIRMALQSLLACENLAPEAFDSAEALLAEPEIERFAAIISDLQMPGINGLSLAREIRRRYAVPILLITAFPAKGLEEQARAAGISAVLRKPFDPMELIDRLVALIG